MRKKKLISLIVSVSIIGFALVTMIMKDKLDQKSDGEILREAQVRMQQEQEALRNKVLSAPDSCTGVPATIFAQICSNNLVYEDATETVHIPYYTDVEPSQAKCVKDSYNARMGLYAQKNGRDHDPDVESSDRHAFISLHACSVSEDFLLFVNDFSLEDPDVDAAKALNLWYQYDDDEYCRKSKEHSWCS